MLISRLPKMSKIQLWPNLDRQHFNFAKFLPSKIIKIQILAKFVGQKFQFYLIPVFQNCQNSFFQNFRFFGNCSKTNQICISFIFQAWPSFFPAFETSSPEFQRIFPTYLRLLAFFEIPSNLVALLSLKGLNARL